MRVVNAGSFSAAARSWGLSKAVMSKYVSALESHLGVALLRRTTRSLSLTDAGREYFERCVEVLGELESIEAALHDDHVQPRGLLRVTAPPGLVSEYGPVLTTAFTAKYPHIRMDLRLTHRMVDLVEEGIDVAIRVTAPRDSSLIARRLAPAPIVAVAAPSYLAQRGTPATPSDLRTHDCLVDTNYRDQGRWRFRHRGRSEVVEVDGPFRVNSPTAVRDLALAGHGVALVPAFVAAEALASGELVEILAGTVAFDWSIFALYPRRRHVSGRVRAFVDHLVRALGPDPEP